MSVAVSIKGWLRKRIVEPVFAFLRQGVTPDKLALSLAFGIGIGIFPVLGVSSIACTGVALALRLNLPAIQLFNWLAGPLQLALIIPFVRVGEHLVGSAPQPLTIAAGFQILSQGVFHAIIVMWDAIVHAAIGWIVLGPLLIYAMYRLTRPVLERAARKIVAARTSAQGAA